MWVLRNHVSGVAHVHSVKKPVKFGFSAIKFTAIKSHQGNISATYFLK